MQVVQVSGGKDRREVSERLRRGHETRTKAAVETGRLANGLCLMAGQRPLDPSGPGRSRTLTRTRRVGGWMCCRVPFMHGDPAVGVGGRGGV